MTPFDPGKYYVYIAAPFPLKPQADYWRQRLEQDGFVVCSRWITQPGSAVIGDEWARGDLHDVGMADCLLALNPADWAEKGTGGRHVEFGYALALEIPVLVVGARTNIFHHLAKGVTVVEQETEALETLMRWRQQYLETRT